MALSPNVRQRTRLGALLLLALTTFTGCPAVYPELGTRLRAPAPGQVLDPPPPEDMRWIKFLSGNVPERTRDGRTWGAGAGSLPDPYARLLLNGKEVLRTNPQSDTLEPTWPGSPAGNFVVKPEDHLRVEMWDSNALNDKPIGIRDFRPSADQISLGRVPIELEGGARVEIAFEPAHAQVGLGLWYELRTSSIYITRTSPSGPAERAGVQRDDQILAIGGREVRKMTTNQVRSAFNAVPLTGIVLLLKHPAGSTETVTVTEGPIYPTFEQVGPLP
ncbi:PDZ domain-containing protein [Chondromyces apiculatus]|uniref:Uncharacterized protein n=1 Tax=Chondromyces apiculatus DSM 436 TaxID=1192034 RepID=A0A017TJF4_9BACT|nr:PDZ domain-containing protein [Chondromyces apiculatus]EYF08970.1 Hypothetical protein CAP_0054 [Chondromyces apiculatus DSM 436]